MFMMSSGGLTAAELFQGKDRILSGPAGGVVGMAADRARGGLARLIGFDMAAPRPDVSHFDGEFERTFETEVAGVRMRAPMMLIHTVAAGGGSILHYDGAALRVGPDSAGANPAEELSPRRALTVTDANVMVGKLIAGSSFRRFSDDAAAAARRPGVAKPLPSSRTRSAARARDCDGSSRARSRTWRTRSRKYPYSRSMTSPLNALNCFGGAGGQQPACGRRARQDHRADPSRSHRYCRPLRMGLADIRRHSQQAIEQPDGVKAVAAITRSRRVAQETVREVAGQDVATNRIKVFARAQIRYAGTDHRARCSSFQRLRARRAAAAPPCQRKMKPRSSAPIARIRFIDRSKELVIEAVSVEAWAVARASRSRAENHARWAPRAPHAARASSRKVNGSRERVPRRSAQPGQRSPAPRSSSSHTQTVLVEPGVAAAITAR